METRLLTVQITFHEDLSAINQVFSSYLVVYLLCVVWGLMCVWVWGLKLHVSGVTVCRRCGCHHDSVGVSGLHLSSTVINDLVLDMTPRLRLERTPIPSVVTETDDNIEQGRTIGS
jgi:hypothetical protein